MASGSKNAHTRVSVLLEKYHNQAIDEYYQPMIVEPMIVEPLEDDWEDDWEDQLEYSQTQEWEENDWYDDWYDDRDNDDWGTYFTVRGTGMTVLCCYIDGRTWYVNVHTGRHMDISSHVLDTI